MYNEWIKEILEVLIINTTAKYFEGRKRVYNLKVKFYVLVTIIQLLLFTLQRHF